MKSIKDLPIVQERPPPGGFPAITVERRLPSSGPTGAAILGVGFAVWLYGQYRISVYKASNREEAEELRAVRIAITPALQAEYDLRYLEDRRRLAAYEAELMKNVPGWVPGEYTTRHRWMVPKEHFETRSLVGSTLR